jgi:hypothetical protein
VKNKNRMILIGYMHAYLGNNVDVFWASVNINDACIFDPFML